MFTRGSWGEKILHHLIVGMIRRVALGVYGRGVYKGSDADKYHLGESEGVGLLGVWVRM